MLTLGGTVYAALVQNKTRGNLTTFIGPGKVEEAKNNCRKDINIVVINVTIKPGQLHELYLKFVDVNPKILVWDRVSLILNFSRHAKTSEAKLQIRFAKMRQMGPEFMAWVWKCPIRQQE